MLGVKDKGILLQIIKRCNRVIEKVSNISETEFSLNDDIKEVVCFNLFPWYFIIFFYEFNR